MHRESIISRTQYGIYLECISNPEATTYNIPLLISIPDDISVEKVRDSIVRSINAHEALTSRIAISKTGDVMLRSGEALDIKTFEMSDEEFELRKKELVRPFALGEEQLCRVEFYITKTHKYMFLDIHHVISDGTTFHVLFDDFKDAMDGKEVLPESCSAADINDEEQMQRKSPEFEKARSFYTKLLDGIETDCTPLPDVHGEEKSQGWLDFEATIDGESLNELKNKYGISKSAFFTTAAGFVTARFNAVKQSVISTVYSGRNKKEYNRTATMLVKTFPVVTDFEKQDSIIELLKTAQSNIVESRKNTLYSYVDAAAEFGLVNDINVVYQGSFLDYAAFVPEGFGIERIYDSAHIEETKLAVEVNDIDGQGIRIHVGYRKDFYSEEFVKSYINAFINACKGFLSFEKLDEVSLTDEEDFALLDSFNDNKKKYDSEHTVIDLFRKIAEKYPNNTAVVYKEKKISYRELDELTDLFALYLSDQGISREKRVAILIPRSEYMVICALSVMKAGGTYLPLDPSYPPERLNLMVQDAEALLLITTPELSGIINEEFSGKRIMIADIKALCKKCAEENEGSDIRKMVDKLAPSLEDLYILLYTSGSTGVPKGVRLLHRNMTAFCGWAHDYQKLDENCRVAAYASFGFDANMYDTYPALTSGAQLHIIEEDIRLDLRAIYQYYLDNRITHGFMTTQIARQFLKIGEMPDLKFFLTGGEKLAPVDPPAYRFCNGYGPTETTCMVSCFELDKYYSDIPIGKSINNVSLYIVDAAGHRLPVGAAGELWISGRQVSGGYLNRPEKTAESFIANPFSSDENYKTIYRSGDVVRYLADGNIQFIGRRDAQVKVRGFRIELTEVEEIIRRFPNISDATTQAFDDPAGGKYVVAYVVSKDGSEIDIDAMNQFILDEKPPYMVPAVTMQIDAIPYNQNQKVNKRVLPKPERKVEKITPPENETQQIIYDIAKKLLGHDQFGIDTNLQMAGLTSIGFVQFNVELYNALKVSLGISDIMENCTVKKLDECIGKAQGDEFELRDCYMLTTTQQGIFTECMSHPGSTIYNIPVAYRLDDSIDMDTLKKAVVSAFNAHAYVLSRIFMAEDYSIMIKRDEAVEFTEDMIRILKGDFESFKDELVTPFDLQKDILVHAAIITGEKNYLFIDMHHIVSDGTSLAILLEDISNAYQGITLEKESFSGFEVSLLEEKKRAGSELENAKEFYKTLLEDADTEMLPQRNVKAVGESLGYIEIDSEIPAKELKSFCEKENVSMSALFNAAFGLVLGKYTFKEDVLYTTIYNGRSDARMAHIISMLVKTFPVRCKINGDEKTADYVSGIGRQMMESMANDVYSFGEISREYDVSADILFTYQGDMFDFAELCGKPCESISLSLDAVKAPIDIDAVIKNDRIAFNCNFRSDMYDEVFISSLVRSVAQAAKELTEKEKVSEVSLLWDSAARKLSDFNNTDYLVKGESVNRMFEREAAAYPEKLAVFAAGEELTYGGLNKLANRVANFLVERNIAKDEVIGLISGRSKEVFIGELSIMKAGGAFLPMVPEYPDDRIDFCLTDASARYVITTEAIKAEKKDLFADKPYEVLTIEEMIRCENEENPDINIDEDSLCYCIYTSGSTGTPKGVMIEHRNLRNFLDPNEKNPETANYVKHGHRILSVISISFDFSLMEIMLPLSNGLSVVMASEDMIHDPLALAEIIKKYKVDVMSCTPSFIGNMIDIPQIKEALAGMHLYDFGAEAFPSKLYEKISKASPEALICNGYGPTETTISCISKILDSGENITIGRPAANVKTYVCDKFMNILPPFACGELVIGGAGVGRGYVGLPEKTAEVFVELEGERVYRSGDLVRILDNGEIEFFGRFDNQVKIRGFRVELDEIENNINTYPGVINSKVIVRNNGSEDYLAAFFTADKKLDIADVTAHLKEKLTYYMVPAVIMQLDAMPLTVNGKIDKKKLPSVEFNSAREYVEPEAGLEKQICDIFGEILKQEKIGATDDFFEIGGTSLTATIVVIRLTNEGFNVVYKDIFEYSTPRELTDFIRGSKKKKGFRDEYDYAAINELLKQNTMEHVDEFEISKLSNIIITGATGFLGIHILREFLETSEGIAYCLIRKGKYESTLHRLKNMFAYYFGTSLDAKYADRIVCIDGDITDTEQLKQLRNIDADVVINCAALVKHFVSDDSLDRINVGGVKNLIEMCLECGKRLVQISTTSVGGMLTKDMRGLKIKENRLWFDQVIDNDYIRTKFLAERAVLEARAQRGLDGIIIRVGNLMSRNSDGEFQINFITNGFMRSLKAFKQLGAFSLASMHEAAEFSPIDSTAAAILKLASVKGKMCVFHADNSHLIYMSDVIGAMNDYGFDIKVVSETEFADIFQRASKDDRMSGSILGLIAYNSGDEEPLWLTESDNRFSVEVLYRLGYLWPITDNKYLNNVISVLDGFEFFELD